MLNNLTLLLESLLNEESLEDFYKKQKSRFPKLIKQIEYLEQNQVPIKYFNFIKKQLSSTQNSIENIVNQALSSDKSKLKIDKPEENYFSTQKNKYPHLSKQINYLEQNKVPQKYIDWIIKQINIASPEPVEDIVPLVQSFEKNQGQLEKKNINQYENTGELHHALEDLNANKEQELQSRTISSSNIQDVLAEKDGWYVTFPHTTQASCDLGKSTTWCTARTQSGNMFLNYVAAKQDTILFYVINPNLNVFKEPFAKMSIGYVKGEPKFDLGDNNITVNADNKNITQEKFIEVVGEENASLFLNAMSRKAKELEGVHPAQKEMEAIAQDYNLFLKKVATYKDTPQNYEAKKEFFKLLLKKYGNEISQLIKNYIVKFHEETMNNELAAGHSEDLGVLTNLSKNIDIGVRSYVAKNPNTPPEVLTTLSNDLNKHIKKDVVQNPNTPLEALTKLANEPEIEFKIAVLLHKNTPPVEKIKIMSTASGTQISRAKQGFAENPETDPTILAFLANDYKALVAENPNTPPEALTILSNDNDKKIRRRVADNSNTPPEALTILSNDNDNDNDILFSVANNPNTKSDDLTQLANKPNIDIKMSVAEHLNTKPDVLTILAKDSNSDVRQHVAKNPNTKSETLDNLAYDDEENVRFYVARNINTPTSALLFLVYDHDQDVVYHAKRNPNFPKNIQENRIIFNSNRFKQLIGK